MSDTSEPFFADLGLDAALMQALDELGYERPTAIQAAAIPPLLEGRDLLGQAQTGTGKTAAFALPLLQQLDLKKDCVQAIVLTPTRELAIQVAEAVRSYGKRMGGRGGVHVLPVYGGQPIHVQLKALRRGVHVVIGTPGRVKDHLERRSLDLSQIRFFGLDEADEMLKMGFIEDVEWILSHAPAERQVALFSATLPKPIKLVADTHLRNPVDIQIARQSLSVPQIEQLCVRVPGHQKPHALERLLEAEEFEAVLIFGRTQRVVGELAERLESRGHHAECVHGGMSQVAREAVVRRLRDRRTQIVVATDVAARGLDVDHIDLVINYDLPMDQEVYVHRIGRTGRAGRAGRSISFWQPRERRHLQSIERYSGQPLSPYRLPGRAEVMAMRRARFATQVREQAASNDEDFVKLAEALVAEDGLDATAVAAAALRMAWGDGPISAEPEPERPSRPQAQRGGGADVEIVIPLGRGAGIGPGDIVGAIAGETGLPSNVVGSIRVLETVTFVGVAAAHVHAIIEALQGTTMRGKEVRPRLAHPEGGNTSPRPAPSDRPARGQRYERSSQRPRPKRQDGPRRRDDSPPWKKRSNDGPRSGPPAAPRAPAKPDAQPASKPASKPSPKPKKARSKKTWTKGDGNKPWTRKKRDK